MLSEEHHLRNRLNMTEMIANLIKIAIITGIVNCPFPKSRDIMIKLKSYRRLFISAILKTATCSLLLCSLSLSSPAGATMAEHQMNKNTDMAHEEPMEMGHQKPSEMSHNQPAAMNHEDHGDDAGDPAVHVHPTQTKADESKVGLDEKLGDIIPLDLVFTDEQGKPVSLAELVTKPTVIAPVYYRCPNVCHFLQGDLARVLPELKLKGGDDYQVISFSFDEKEKPELAQRSRDTYYAAMKNNYPDKAWRFLTGDRETILQLTDAAGYRFQKAGTEFLHPVVFFVVSPEGQIVRYLHGTHVLPKDLTLALYEAKTGHVGTTIRKMVQYCFSFDPEQKTYVFNILRVSATAILTTLALFAAYLVFGGKKSKKINNDTKDKNL
jgi:protein SCO1/2